MKKWVLCLIAPIVTSVTQPFSGEELTRHPLSFGSSLDFGQVVNGRFYEQPGPDSVANGQVITRTGVYLNSGGNYGNLDIKITIGALFWSILPESREEFEKRIIYPGAGIGQAQAIYSFGEPENPWATLSMGYFPIKYNPDSKNLGEYLHRSGTYPGVVYTGGWSLINSAAYMAQGVKFSMPVLDGTLTHDFTLNMERDMEPIYDFSPGYVFQWKPTSYFEFGAGLVWAHGLSMQADSILTPKNFKNAYDTRTNKPLLYNDLTTGETGKPHYRTGDPAIDTTNANNGVPGEFLGFYTFKGFKTMARVSLDLGELFGLSESMGDGAFKIYSEWAWLGIQNQPYFYDKPSERMPIMLGINIPTYKFLENFGVEVEYRKSRFQNTFRSGFYEQIPLPWDAIADVSVYDLNDPAFAEREKDFKKDDLKWSIYAKKNIMNGLTLFGQAASDHVRFITTEGGGKFRPTFLPSTREASHWYYVLRLEFGI